MSTIWGADKAFVDKYFTTFPDYYESGDAGYKDEDGYVSIRDRSKDLIISGGENVSSLSVEAALMEHDAVALCAVVARPDGSRVFAVWIQNVHNVSHLPGAAPSTSFLRMVEKSMGRSIHARYMGMATVSTG